MVGQLSKQNADPRVGHLKAVKRVIWYLKDTIHLSIIYGAKSSPSQETSDRQLQYKLVGYINSNYASDPEDQKWIMRHCFFINGEVVLWYSKKQQIVPTSTTKAKYITLGHIA